MNFAPYIGWQWRPRGCWELLRQVYAEQLAITVPSYAEEYGDGAHGAELIEAESVAWHMVPAGSERPGDAVLFNVAGEAAHVGIVTRRGRFLHIRQGQTAVIEDYRTPVWARRLVGFYRHAEAA